MNYQLIFKHPETGSEVAYMDLLCADEDAAAVRFKDVGGYMAGELWCSQTLLRIFTPEPVQFAL